MDPWVRVKEFPVQSSVRENPGLVPFMRLSNESANFSSLGPSRSDRCSTDRWAGRVKLRLRTTAMSVEAAPPGDAASYQFAIIPAAVFRCRRRCRSQSPAPDALTLMRCNLLDPVKPVAKGDVKAFMMASPEEITVSSAHPAALGYCTWKLGSS